MSTQRLKQDTPESAEPLKATESALYVALNELMRWHGPGSAASLGASCETLGEALEQAHAALAKAESES